MKRKKVLAIALAATMMMSMAACGSDGGNSGSKGEGKDGKIVLKVGSTVQDTAAGGRAILEVFKPRVEELTDGKITVEVYNNSVLGGDRQMLEALQINTLQMAAAPLSVMANFDAKFNASELPFVFKDKPTAYAALDGDLGDMMAKDIESQGMKVLGYTENSFRNISNNKHAIEKVSDLKGLKIRVMESPMYLNMFKMLGANPTPMAFNELYTGLQQGTVDGQDNGITLTYTAKLYEVQKYYTLVGQNYAAGAFVISKSFWDSLDSDMQDALLQAAKETGAKAREWNTEEETEYIEKMKEAGVQVNELSDDAKAEIKSILVPAIWKEYKDQIGDELYQELLKVEEKYEK